MRIAIAVLLAGAVLLALASWWRPVSTPRSEPAASMSASVAAEEQPKPVPPAPAALPAVAASSPDPAPSPPPAAPEGPPPAVPFEVPPLAQHYANMYASRFDADPPDPDLTLARDLSARVSNFLPAGARAEPVECHRSMCRVRTFHPDRATYDAYVEKAFLAPDPNARVWPGQTWIAVPPDRPDAPPGERVVSSIYLERGAADEH